MNDTRTQHILIVDDDTDLARSLALIFKRKGFVPSIAADGLSALAQVEATPFDVVLMDIRMPGLDGIETYQRIKQIHPDLAVILMTGFAPEERAQTGLREGALAVLTKPLDLDHLVKLIEDAIAHHHALALVVDDYPESCVLLTRILQRKGYTIACVETGEQAVARVKERQYDVIFLDLKLPAMNGLQTYQAIRALDARVAVVMMTGYRAETDALVQAALQQSAYACLYKPFSAEQVLALIDELQKTKDEGRKTTVDR